MKKQFLEEYNYVYKKRTLRAFIRRVYNSIKNRFLTEPFFLNKNPKFNAWQIGDYTYGSPDGSPLLVYSGEKAKLQIGKFCSIAQGVTIFIGGNHRPDWVTTYPFSVVFDEAAHIEGHPNTKGDVIIGNDVWIGFGATIMSGVTIGNGAVIAAKSLVTKNVPAYTIVGGHTAAVIKKRFDDETIAQLEQLKWWDWEISKILANMDLLLSNNIQEFISKSTKK